ncbi:MAG: DUF1491 family protein [Rubricella sp.]
MTARLATGVWVAAYRRRLELAGIPCFVTARGDETSGAVLVKCATMDGAAQAFHRTFNAEWERVWDRLTEGPEPMVDAEIARQRRSDPDLWVIEIEDRAGRTLLEEEGLE